MSGGVHDPVRDNRGAAEARADVEAHARIAAEAENTRLRAELARLRGA
jgi:hypothetical protein